MKKLFHWMFAAILLCGAMTTPSSCMKEDNAASQQTALIKQGVWTEYDTILVAAGKKTAEELAEMPSVGMLVCW